MQSVKFAPSLESLERKLNLDSLPFTTSYFGGAVELPEVSTVINPNDPATWPKPDWTLSPYPTEVKPPFGDLGNVIPWDGNVPVEDILPHPVYNAGDHPLPLLDYNMDCPPLACQVWVPDYYTF